MNTFRIQFEMHIVNNQDHYKIVLLNENLKRKMNAAIKREKEAKIQVIKIEMIIVMKAGHGRENFNSIEEEDE